MASTVGPFLLGKNALIQIAKVGVTVTPVVAHSVLSRRLMVALSICCSAHSVLGCCLPRLLTIAALMVSTSLNVRSCDPVISTCAARYVVLHLH